MTKELIDDREALDKIVTEYDLALYTKEETLDRLSRAAVPDAATAAITAARAVCLQLGGVDGDVSQPAPSYYVSVGRNVVATEVLAALDGAPEPEWEYGFHFVGDDENIYKTRGGWDTPERAQALGDEWIVDERESHLLNNQPDIRVVLVRRRKASPWLPVEGESDNA